MLAIKKSGRKKVWFMLNRRDRDSNKQENFFRRRKRGEKKPKMDQKIAGERWEGCAGKRLLRGAEMRGGWMISYESKRKRSVWKTGQEKKKKKTQEPENVGSLIGGEVEGLDDHERGMLFRCTEGGGGMSGLRRGGPPRHCSSTHRGKEKLGKQQQET